MAKRKTKEEAAIDAAEMESDDAVFIGTAFDDGVGDSVVCMPPPAPTPADPGWSDYVLSHFVEGEMDREGSPSTDACRRVVNKLLGPIVCVEPKIVQVPEASNGYRAAALVSVTIAFDGDRGDLRTYGDGSDVYPGNTDELFARHAVATAITKAEGRAYRKALMLRKVITAEEKTSVSVTECGLDRYITDGQLRAIDKTCRDVGVNVKKFLHACKITGSHSLIKYEKAIELLEGASRLLQNPDKIPVEIKGYDPAWRES